MEKRWTPILAALVVSVAGAACERTSAAVPAAAGTDEHRPVHIDSIFPIEEEIRRFRAMLDEAPERLTGGTSGRDALVHRFVQALEAEDAGALRGLQLTRAEFAHLYFPFTRYTSRPYELSPALLWFRLENYSSKGLNRALRRYGGSPLGFTGYHCGSEPEVEERNRIWSRCVLERSDQAGRAEQLPILGPILERDGHFKFLSYANGL